MSSTSAETDTCDQVSEKIKTRGRSRAVAVLLLLSLVTIAVYSLIGSTTPDGQQHASVLVPGGGPSSPIGKKDSTAKSTKSQSGSDKTPAVKSPRGDNVSDDELRKLIIGKWQREFSGWRTLTVASGGTASMVIEPDQVWSLLFGNRLETRIEWKIKNGRIIYHTTSGVPADKYEVAVKMWGKAWNEVIERLDSTTLVLLDDNGERCEYKRAGSKTK